MKAKVTIVEFGQQKPKHEFVLSASVAKLHPAEGSKQSEGRGIFFEDAEDNDHLAIIASPILPYSTPWLCNEDNLPYNCD